VPRPPITLLLVPSFVPAPELRKDTAVPPLNDLPSRPLFHPSRKPMRCLMRPEIARQRHGPQSSAPRADHLFQHPPLLCSKVRRAGQRGTM
jgi:hypothetical protein